MRNRLLGCLAGSILGVWLAALFSERLGLTATVAYAGGVLAGMALGCAASILFDVFAGSPASVPAGSQE